VRRGTGHSQLLASLALVAGALAIGSAGIFVRLSETGPIASAFWRGAFALPLLAVWARFESGRGARGAQVVRSPWEPRFFWVGALFAGDLAFWHWSLMLTSIALSTLEANLAPIGVTLIAWIAWRERPRPTFVAALLLALGGVSLMVSPKLGQGSRALLGDLLGIATAGFYAGYIVVVARLRASYATNVVMFRTTLVYTLLLLPLALMDRFLPQTKQGWLLLVALAVIAQVVGQGLIAFALAHVSATFGSVGLYVQPVASAVYAWLLLGERLTAIQVIGGAITLSAIALARATTASGPGVARPSPAAGIAP
jgi:drug/metabolite transporter (DMT)-like permease